MAYRQRNDLASQRPEGIWDASGDEPAYPLPPSRGRFADLALTLFGLTALLMPLVLWIAWSQAMLMTAFGIGAVAIAGCWLIVHFGPD